MSASVLLSAIVRAVRYKSGAKPSLHSFTGLSASIPHPISYGLFREQLTEVSKNIEIITMADKKWPAR